MNTFAERLVSREKLLFYSWRIIYPKYGIDDPIPGNREPLISIETAHKILEKLEARWIRKPRRTPLENYLLRWMLYCPELERPYYSWPSTGKDWGKYYHYYLQGDDLNKAQRKRTQTKFVHQELRELIENISVKKWFIQLIKKVFQFVYSKKNQLMDDLKKKE